MFILCGLTCNLLLVLLIEWLVEFDYARLEKGLNADIIFFGLIQEKECESLSSRSKDQIAEIQKLQATV